MKLHYKILFGILILLGGGVTYFYLQVTVDPPQVKAIAFKGIERKKIARDTYTFGQSWFRKSDSGFWEMYLQGDSYALGLQNGILSKDLVYFHEKAFIDFLYKKIPSENYLRFLKYVVAWFNRDLDDHIPVEYQKEIYGISQVASDEFDFVGPRYQRILNYHAAHDIGHAMQNMNLVACTTFAVWGNRSEDGGLLIGRNFDFDAGEEFQKNKILAFYRPEKGHKFMMVTWGGMIGVVSGMNDQGLTVTLNAAKSEIPTSAKTPVSILARKILQYAGNIDEAYQIAREYDTFVAESFMIGSAADKKAVVIEKTPENIALYETFTEELTLTNHFQSDAFKDTELTKQNVKEGASLYRLERLQELLTAQPKHNPTSFAAILRDQKGKQNKNIGAGNEKIINQLVAHHSIIFKPEKLQFWISTGPYPLGEFVAYDLNKVFSDDLNIQKEIREEYLTIPSDPFLRSEEFKNYKLYQKETRKLRALLDDEKVTEISEERMAAYLRLNPEFYYAYYLAGRYYALKGQKVRAAEYFNMGMKKEIPRLVDTDLLKKELNELKEL